MLLKTSKENTDRWKAGTFVRWALIVASRPNPSRTDLDQLRDTTGLPL